MEGGGVGWGVGGGDERTNERLFIINEVNGICTILFFFFFTSSPRAKRQQTTTTKNNKNNDKKSREKIIINSEKLY